MIKLVIKLNKNILNEALFKYSQTAANEIFNNLLPYFKKGKKRKISVGVILKEALYDKIAQNNGAPFLYHANGLGKEFSDIPELSKYWNSKNKSFDNKYIRYILNQKFPIDVELSNKITDKKTFGHIFVYQEDSISTTFKIVFYIKNFNNNEKIFNQAIKHELRHIGQYINKLAIKYGEEIYLENDIKKMFPIPLRIKEEFLFAPIGLGRQKTGLETDTHGSKYVQGDVEFEPHIADIVEYSIDALLKTNEKEIFNSNIDSKTLSENFVDKIINNRIFGAIVFKQSGRMDLFNAVYQLNKARPNEFSKKFKKNLKIEIDNVRNK